MPLELLRESQSPRGAVCGNRGCFWTMHGSVSAPSCCSFTHRVAFEEVSGHRVLLNCGPGNQGRSTWGTSHGACLEFPREAGLILRGAVQAGNPFQTTQGNQLSCREQERSRSSEEVVPGLSVFPSREPGMSGNFWMSHEGCQVPCLTSRRNMGLPLRRRTGQGPHLAKTLKPRGFSRVAAGFSSFDEDFRLPLGLALGSPISHSSSEGNLGVALESLQGQRDLIKACVLELIFLSREGRNLGVAFQAPSGSQASSRGEAKDSALLSSGDADLLEPTEWPQGSPASSSVWREDPGLLSRPCRNRRPSAR